MLEVFNTLLRQLRLSVDYELTGSYDGSTNIGTKIIKAHEERQLQEAVIRTIGECVFFAVNALVGFGDFCAFIPFPLGMFEKLHIMCWNVLQPSVIVLVKLV